MAKVITNMKDWLFDNGDRLYRYLVYKKIFTPFEQQHAFEDESVYEDIHYELCKIEEVIDIGGDWFLGLRTIGEDGKIYGMTYYYKLSEIRLALFENDQHIKIYEDKENENDEL